MQTGPAHSGDLSQDSAAHSQHPTTVTAAKLERSVDPANRAGRSFYQALSASSVGLEFGISVALGLAFGIFLDGKLGTAPWMMLGFLAVGFAAGFRGVLRAVNRSDRWAAADAAAASAAKPTGGSRG